MKRLKDEQILDVFDNLACGCGEDVIAKAFAQAQLEQDQRDALEEMIEWGDGSCEHNPPIPKSRIFKRGLQRKDCPECWQSLKKELEELSVQVRNQVVPETD